MHGRCTSMDEAHVACVRPTATHDACMQETGHISAGSAARGAAPCMRYPLMLAGPSVGSMRLCVLTPQRQWMRPTASARTCRSDEHDTILEFPQLGRKRVQSMPLVWPCREQQEPFAVSATAHDITHILLAGRQCMHPTKQIRTESNARALVEHAPLDMLHIRSFESSPPATSKLPSDDQPTEFTTLDCPGSWAVCTSRLSKCGFRCKERRWFAPRSRWRNS